ncbi:hypothetical protein [Microvirga calopogonii]|uniref:hypothetical protein n=1 Tax=Microvirga calopogonii TaxID=2078013 RepID=UPI000E0DC172|nr:hypothetical protein [Microvirga calopogonii]
MTVFLGRFSRQLGPGVYAMLVFDYVGWHDARALHIPGGITLLPSSASLGLNPVGRNWLCLRERHLSHPVLDDYEAVLQAVCRA